MANAMQFEICPETGICSIVRGGTAKIDLMPDEVEAIRAVAGDADGIQAVLAENDSTFAVSLSTTEIAEIGKVLAR